MSPIVYNTGWFSVYRKNIQFPINLSFFLGDSESYVAAEAYLTYLWSLWIHFSYLSPFSIMYSVANHYCP